MLVLAGCGRHRVQSCADDLHGVYVSPAGERWMMLDNQETLEAYPMFDDTHGPADLVIAPRVVDLSRLSTRARALDGIVSRRYMRRAESCTARAAFHVTACTAEGLDVVWADVAPPLALTPCAFAPSLPSRAEHWRRD